MRLRAVRLVLALALMPLMALGVGVSPSAAAGEITVELRPSDGPLGTVIEIVGRDATPNAAVTYVYGGFGDIDDCLYNTTSGQGEPGGITQADSQGNFTLRHLAAQHPNLGSIRFAVSDSGRRTSPWACFRVVDAPGGGGDWQISPLAWVSPLSGPSGTVFTIYASGLPASFQLHCRFFGADMREQSLGPCSAEANGRGGWVTQIQTVDGMIPAGFHWVKLYDESGAFVVGTNFETTSPACQVFPETGKQVCGRFLEYWQANGGLAQQGLPLTDVFAEVNPTDGKVYQTQYFERARFEHHPENPAPYDVLLGLLGREQYQAKYPGGRPPTNLEGRPDFCFVQTQRCVAEPFLSYWRDNGGLAQQGFPLSDQFAEVSPTNGQTYHVQYFERARFEYHPENAGTPYVVLLGLLGREQLAAKYPNGIPSGPPPSTSPSPAPSASPTPAPSPSPDPRAGCDPSYPTLCLPPGPPDVVNCADITQRNFPVRQPDPHRLDNDKDGVGCEE